MNKRGIRGRIGLLGVVATLVIVLAIPAVALAAAANFNGGPDQWPLYVLNDHTPVAVHFSTDASSGLAPNTQYYLKVRYTVATTPSGLTNRGFTWNAASATWVQERDAWTGFPTVTTDASGAISSSAGWAFVKFGDDTKSGQYHIMISLSSTGDASTFNGSFVPTVTVLDPRTGAAWVHNGVATGKVASTRAAITDPASSTIISLQKTEAQGVDDNSDGVVDNEDYGPAGATGDFHMGVPTSTAISVNLNKVMWAPATGFQTSLPDVDLAVSAADTVAPSGTGPLACVSGDNSATLSWTAATDNDAVAGYYVYRWQAAPGGAAYSPVHSRIATLSAGQLSYDDSTVVNGQTYLYEVRAFDASTNVGPRSTTATAAPFLPEPVAVVSPEDPDGENGWYVTTPTVTLTASGPGRTCVYSLENTPSTWTTYTVPVQIPNGASKLTFAEKDDVSSLMSATSSLQFNVDTVKPTAGISAPPMTVPAGKDGRFRVTWSGSDGGSGVAGYDVEYRVGASGSWTPWRGSTSATSAVFAGAAGSNIYFHSRTHDVAGNVSSWTAPVLTLVPSDQGLAAFSAGWKKTTSPGYFLGDAAFSTKKGAYAVVKYTSGTLYLVSRTDRTLGKMAVYYRGKKIATIDLYSAKPNYRQAFKIVSMPSGTPASTVKLVNLGVAHRERVEIDGFVWKR